MSVYPPSPKANLRPLSARLHQALIHRSFVTFVAGFALISLLAGSGTVSAQTRKKRAATKTEIRARRVETKDQLAAEKPGAKRILIDDAGEPPANPQVRKTALTYTPKPGNNGADRPSLTNDIVIISRAPERSAGPSTLSAKASAANIPSIWPVQGALRSGVGMRNNPFGGPGIEYHKGQDISAPMGTPVFATADGVVVIARWVRGYGNGIYVDHGNGITTRYGHLSRIDVAEGQIIKRGTQLGLVGSTGRSTGPHLHYEVRINGEPTSPLYYLPANEPATAKPTAAGN